MTRWLLITLLAVLGLAVAVAPVSADTLEEVPLSPAEVVAIDRALDGTRVVVEGEAVGESLRARGGGRWVNILGEGVGLGIWVTDGMAEVVQHYGDYKNDGDTVRAVGTLHIACAQHAGEFDVHAERLEVIERGGPREMNVDLTKGFVGAAGLVLAFVLYRWYQRRRDHRML
ncbi:MAG: hypothetical protein RBS78_01055 [Coriobacteriia bacterium]|jgi:hypothetical protein|nr:hypothetical protein [Coriobacteriia bacterium]